MAVDIVMPQMGESIFEGTITKWLKKPGDKVERDEPLFEISTDKVDAEIPSPSAGVLKEIKVGEGQTVPIQTIVGVIDAAGSAASAPAPAQAKPAAPAPAPPAAKAPLLRPHQRPGPLHPRPPPCRLRLRQLPPEPRPALQASGYTVHRWSGAWPRNTASTFLHWKVLARADASASRISKPRLRERARRLLLHQRTPLRLQRRRRARLHPRRRLPRLGLPVDKHM
jgi:pyruvate/2-oxoglutarate dehydrogenase complex dihydrolipoamide acyltransferase (E2) component